MFFEVPRTFESPDIHDLSLGGACGSCYSQISSLEDGSGLRKVLGGGRFPSKEMLRAESQERERQLGREKAHLVGQGGLWEGRGGRGRARLHRRPELGTWGGKAKPDKW